MSNKWMRESLRLKILLFILTLIFIVFLFPRGESVETEVSVGSVWVQDDLIANVSFPILKESETYKKELEEAKNQAYPIFENTVYGGRKTSDSINAFFTVMISQLDNALERDDWLPTTKFISDKSFKLLKDLRQKEKQFHDAEIPLPRLMILADSASALMSNVTYLNMIHNDIEKDSIAIRTGAIDQIVPKQSYPDYKSFTDALAKTINRFGLKPEISLVLNEILTRFYQPDFQYSEDLTKKDIEGRQKKILNTSGLVKENERIIAKHERVTPEIKLKIDSYKVEKGKTSGWDGTLKQYIGKTLHIFVLLSLLVIFLYYFRKELYKDNFLLSIFAILISWICVVTYLVTNNNVSHSLYLLVFIPTASMIITIIFDSRVGIFFTVIVSLIASALRGNDYTFAVSNMSAGLLAVYTVRDIKYRAQIFRSLFYIFLGYAVSIIAFGFESFSDFSKILMDLGLASVNALISPVLTFGLLVFFERMFGITTDLTLLELTNYDRPLMKMLMQSAPGTFNHSVAMASIAEAAADKIEANTLLVRVGAYYHDIGKISHSFDFVENQQDRTNVHTSLQPEESALVIKRHVAEGMELGRSYNLPEKIIEFIPSHHGTTVIKYFYQKAVEMYGVENVNIDEYRYPGPRPKTKETAILMLADTCESAARTIDEPNRQNLSELIERLIDEKVEDGQLAEAPITFADISTIKNAFVENLLSQRHPRIKYPNQDKKKESSDR